MSKRYLHTLLKYVCLALSLSAVFFGVTTGFCADAYTVPQTAEVTLAWDPNDPTPAGYRIFQRTEGETYDYDQPVWTGSATTGTIYNLDWDKNYYFVVRAFDGDLESADSEEVSYHSPIAQTTTYSITTTAGDNGSISPSGVLDYAAGVDQTFSIAPASGYYIADVLVDGVSQGAIASYTFSQIDADHTIEAVFATNTYTISAASGDNGSISPVGDSQVTHGSSRTYLITPDNGFHIANVLVDGVAQGVIASYTFENVTADHTIIANFAVNTYQISASAGSNGSVSPSGTTSVAHGESLSYTIAPASGYHIAEVFVDGATIGAVGTYTFTGVEANHTIHATFAVDTFTIAASADANGSISPAGIVEVNYGAGQTFKIAPDAGYHVADVVVDGESKGAVTSYSFNQLVASHSINASFAVNTYTISASAGDNGSISPLGSTQVNYGGSQTYSIQPAQGYLVADVLVNGVSQGPVTTYTFSQVTADQTISARFSLETASYTITSSAGANGRISPEGRVSVASDASQTYTITPDAGYHIAKVSVDGASVGAVSSYTFKELASDHTIAATFEADAFVITAVAGENGSVTPNGVVNATLGSSQTFTFAAASGFHVADVLVDGQSVGVADSYTFSDIYADHTLEVSFAANTDVEIRIEAEDGDLQWPMEIGDDATAGAGGYIWVPAGTGNISSTGEGNGFAEYHLEIPEAGSYIIWARQISNDNASDSFFVSVDGMEEMVWHTKPGGQDVWTWDVFAIRDAASPDYAAEPMAFNLTAGVHTLRISQREDGTKLDQIVITNQLDKVMAEPGTVTDLMEYGEVSVDHDWIRVNFNKTFVNPVVVAGPISLNGSAPAVVRIRNVDTGGFEVRIQEWDYLYITT